MNKKLTEHQEVCIDMLPYTINYANPLYLTDGYKLSHDKMYPNGTTKVYSNFTPRSNKHAPNGINYVVSFGQQFAMMKIYGLFEQFFQGEKEDIENFKTEISSYLGVDYDVSHFEKLHDLGYLPIHVKIIEEGTIVPIKTPILTITNTHEDFYWLPNYLETIISNLLWKPCTSATIALEYKKLGIKYAKETDIANIAFVDYQFHDFSLRGLCGIYASISSGLGHLTSHYGTDSLPTIKGARLFYNEQSKNICSSVPASEHSVMSAGGKETELETFKRLLSLYPTGILSVVSDTWDLWNVLENILPKLKEDILARNGKLVIRPDSGDPADILCGKENKGVIELLWETFGGTINEQGYKVLDPHIGAIYGDSITLQKAEEIFQRLKEKGFASTNVVLGIGSFTYQYNTRDTFGFAMKATYTEQNGKGIAIFKDPITDDGQKKSLKGLLKVEEIDGKIVTTDQVTWEEEGKGLLQTLFCNGKFENVTTLTEIREKLKIK